MIIFGIIHRFKKGEVLSRAKKLKNTRVLLKWTKNG